MLENTMKLFKSLYGDDVDLTKNAVNIRENNSSCQRQNSKNILLEDLPNGDGLKITVKSTAQGETIYIPAFISKSGVIDIVKNDFYIEDGANVKIQAGCAIHTEGKQESKHNGIHRFFIGKNCNVEYLEKHLGTGTDANRVISPITDITLGEYSTFTMDSIQLDGVSFTERVTNCVVMEGAHLDIKERILTQKDQEAITKFNVDIQGDDSSVNVVSRSVAKGNSKQRLESNIIGNAKCSGHSECDAILEDKGIAIAIPGLIANNPNANLVHEAAIGRISKQQIEKLETLGLSEEEAESYIIKGFLK
jgi:Fe-S cluster assembly scaffold protein SufB